MSIATKTGDSGETSLLCGKRVRKNDIRIEAVGSVDELNASIGIAICHVNSESVKDILDEVQNDLFALGAELSSLGCDNNLKKLTPESVEFLDEAVKKVEETLPDQSGFILPQGNLACAHLHFARALCRKAERRCVACRNYQLNENILKYLNRLSDLLHLLARLENTEPEKPVKYESSKSNSDSQE